MCLDLCVDILCWSYWNVYQYLYILRTSDYWYRKIRGRGYLLQNLQGWRNVDNIPEYWYCMPITRGEFLMRAYISGWSASRDLWKERTHKDLQGRPPALCRKLSWRQELWRSYFQLIVTLGDKKSDV